MKYTKQFNLQLAKNIREKVVPNFQKVLPMAKNEGHLDMTEGQVNEDYSCGTIHCHGGWYAVASCDLSICIDYMHGADLLAHNLGFKEKRVNNVLFDPNEMLEEWARNNKSFWGNYKGDLMFALKKAFQSPTRPNGAESLQDIVDHWLEVAERIEKHYVVKYEDATKEILGLELQPKVEQDIINEVILNA